MWSIVLWYDENILEKWVEKIALFARQIWPVFFFIIESVFPGYFPCYNEWIQQAYVHISS